MGCDSVPWSAGQEKATVMVVWRRRPVATSEFDDPAGIGPEVDWVPDLDIYETSDRFLLLLSLPGVHEDEFDVALSHRTLSISGHRTVSLPAGTEAHLVESPRGRFERRIQLPKNADRSRLRVELRDGQLLITIPKAVVESSVIAIELS
jgi:HSP20 family molecular chaperone IbpA